MPLCPSPLDQKSVPGFSGRPRVAVCVDTRDGPGRERVAGIYEYAVQRNWNLFLVRTDDEEAIARICEMHVIGAILYDRCAHFHQCLRAHGIFCVEASARNLDLDHAAIYVDDWAIGEMAALHLLGLKLEHFAYCGLPSRQVPSSGRNDGFSTCLRRHGFATSSFLVDVGESENSPMVLGRWLRDIPKPCGILAFDDRMAEHILTACHWGGISVPREVALVGVGDDELTCELMNPALSSVRLPTRAIGMLAAGVIDAHLQGLPVPTRQPQRPLEVVTRASSERLLRSDGAVSAAIKLIRSNAHSPYGTDQLVEALGVPRRTLERRFLACTGRTVHAYISDYRLYLAKRMLRRSFSPISEVARRSGYSALSAFTRMFIEREGCHPEEYRRNSNPIS